MTQSYPVQKARRSTRAVKPSAPQTFKRGALRLVPKVSNDLRRLGFLSTLLAATPAGRVIKGLSTVNDLLDVLNQAELAKQTRLGQLFKAARKLRHDSVLRANSTTRLSYVVSPSVFVPPTPGAGWAQISHTVISPPSDYQYAPDVIAQDVVRMDTNSGFIPPSGSSSLYISVPHASAVSQPLPTSYIQDAAAFVAANAGSPTGWYMGVGHYYRRISSPFFGGLHIFDGYHAAPADYALASDPANNPGLSTQKAGAFYYVPAFGESPIQKPSLLVTLDPASIPILRPAPEPAHVPYKMLPYLRPSLFLPYQVQRQVAYTVHSGDALSVSATSRRPIPSAAVPLAAPSTAIFAGKRPNVSLDGYHRLKTPGRGTKERKMRAAGTYAAVRVASSVTEALDTLNAVYNALPYAYRPRYPGTSFVLRNPTPQQKLAALYRNWDKVDLVKAGKYLLVENISDIAFGKIGRDIQRNAKALRLHGDMPIGFQTGSAL